MSFELDHILICAPFDAPVANRLVNAGFVEGTRNEHPGQGTANRRFFFDNAFIEFIWMTDEAEILSDLVAPTRLWERMNWRESGASPFEICIRPSGQDLTDIPFSTFAYAPEYLPEGDHIPMADQVPIKEPGAFVNLSRRGQPTPPDDGQPRSHPNGARRVDGITLTIPDAPTSDVSSALTDFGIARYRVGSGHSIEIQCSGGAGDGLTRPAVRLAGRAYLVNIRRSLAFS